MTSSEREVTALLFFFSFHFSVFFYPEHAGDQVKFFVYNGLGQTVRQFGTLAADADADHHHCETFTLTV